MLTAEDLKQIRRLHLQASRKVDTPFSGQYRSAFRGQGMEFEEVRPYVPGDDVRHIDWNVMARTGAPYIQQYREERELSLLLVIDKSPSVDFGSGGLDGRTDKRRQIARIAGGLAFAAIRNGDKVGLVTFSDGVDKILPPRKDRGHAWAVIREAFQATSKAKRTDLAKALELTSKIIRRRSVIAVVSDFASATDYRRPLRILAGKHTVHTFLVHDALEEKLPKLGLIDVRDAETGKVRTLDPSVYARTEPVADTLRELRRSGTIARTVSTQDDPFLQLLLHFQQAGQRR